MRGLSRSLALTFALPRSSLLLSSFLFTRSSIGLSFVFLRVSCISTLFCCSRSFLLVSRYSSSRVLAASILVSSLRITNSRFPPLASSVFRRIFPAKKPGIVVFFPFSFSPSSSPSSSFILRPFSHPFIETISTIPDPPLLQASSTALLYTELIDHDHIHEISY